MNTCIVDRLHSVSNDLSIMMEFANEILLFVMDPINRATHDNVIEKANAKVIACFDDFVLEVIKSVSGKNLANVIKILYPVDGVPLVDPLDVTTCICRIVSHIS